jgi:CheY-like chemotaxis protein
MPLCTSQPAPQISPPRNGKAPSGQQHRHILLVEDQADARRALQRLLQIWGHTVDVAEDGQRAVAMAPSIRPDVALVDIGLPGLDGYAVARQLRAQMGNAIRLIALTGYGQPDDHVRTREAGFNLHLVKPVDAQQLSRVIGDDRYDLAAS